MNRLFALLLCVPALAEPPMVAVSPKSLPQAVADGDLAIRVTASGTLTAPLTLRLGQKLACDEGVTITCEYAEPRPCLILADGCEVRGCKLLGKWTGPADAPVTYDSAHGIGCYGAQNVTIENVTAENFHGDGFYAGPKTLTDRTPCKFTVKASTFRANRRQGASIVSGVGTLDSCLFERTKGASPQAGLDIEPSGSKDTVQVQVVNCAADANWGSPYLVNLDRVIETSPPPRISFTGCKALNTPPHQPTDLRLAAVYEQPGGLVRDGLPKGTLVEWDGLVLARKP